MDQDLPFSYKGLKKIVGFPISIADKLVLYGSKILR